MFDFGSGELLLIGVVALVVIGPKELPGVLRTVGKTVARLRRMAGEFQGQFQDALREAEIHDTVKSISTIQSPVAQTPYFADANPGSLPQQLPVPQLPEPVTPPVELQSPAPAATPSVANAPPEVKPKKPRVRKTKPADEMVVQADPQAALFDRLDPLTKEADAKPDRIVTPKKPRAVKPKPKPKSEALMADAADTPMPQATPIPQATPVVKAKRKPKLKPNTGEAS